MPPLLWFRIIGVFLLISVALAALDEALIWFLPPLTMRELALGVAAGAIVYLLAYRSGSVLRRVIAHQLKSGTLVERGNSILREIAACSGVNARLLVFESPKLITFTVSDGKAGCICISSAMLTSLSRDAIAGVLAHECGHINAKHPHRLALLLALLAAVKLVGTITAIVVIMVILAYLYMQRQWEYEADRSGAGCVGADALITAFSDYRAASREKDLSWFGEIFSAHPSIGKRIAALEKLRVPFQAAGGLCS